MPRNFDLGVMFRCQNPPGDLIRYVQSAEWAGFDELWLVEDCFYAGGIASTATALAATESIRVGLGIMPAVVRNPAFAAMEIAALARLHPGRFMPGFGHGVAEWMTQVGALPPSQLTALEETTIAVRALLRGASVTVHGDYVHLDQVALEFPPGQVPPVALGVRGPRSLRLAGRAADGTIMAEFSAPEYIRWAREQIAGGQREAARQGDPHRVTVYVHCALAPYGDQAAAEVIEAELRVMVGGMLANPGMASVIKPLGIWEEAQALLDEYGWGEASRHIPEDWLRRLAVFGTPEECREGVLRLVEAGADSVVLVPVEHAPFDSDFEALHAYAEHLLPLFA